MLVDNTNNVSVKIISDYKLSKDESIAGTNLMYSKMINKTPSKKSLKRT
jgi:hypothetical protein